MKHLLKMSDLSPAELTHILDVADQLKADCKAGRTAPLLVTRAVRSTGEDARSWRVTLESQRCYPVMSSCGDKPKEGRSWVATEVVELTA